MTSHPATLSHLLHLQYLFPSSIVVSGGSLLPITVTGSTILPGTLNLNDVLVSPKLVHNLIFI